MLTINCFLTSIVQSIWNLDRKWSATAMSASFGQRWNQSIVQPEMSPGNFNALLRNFSPTCWTRNKQQFCLQIHFKPISAAVTYNCWSVFKVYILSLNVSWFMRCFSDNSGVPARHPPAEDFTRPEVRFIIVSVIFDWGWRTLGMSDTNHRSASWIQNNINTRIVSTRIWNWV